jgi:Leucine-rich repeat (LRR) protein
MNCDNEFLIHSKFVEKFPNLEFLEIWRDKRYSGSPIENCQTITSIKFTRTNLEKMDSNFFARCVKLERVEFDEIPIDLTTLLIVKQLKSLKVISSIRTIIPTDFFGALENLEEIQFENTGLQHVDETFLTSLRTLQNIKTINFLRTFLDMPAGSFDGLHSLENLYLGKNNIKLLLRNAFGNLDGIKILSLEGNEIQEIQSNAFEGCSGLLELQLQGRDVKKLTGIKWPYFLKIGSDLAQTLQEFSLIHLTLFSKFLTRNFEFRESYEDFRGSISKFHSENHQKLNFYHNIG